MKMLEQEEEADTEVTWEDQQNINAFSRLHMRVQDLEALYEEKKKEKEYLDDLSSELELADEDEPVKYRIGDAFVSLSLPACQERLKNEQKTLTEELEGYSTKIDSLAEDMNKLKVLLYKKFGNSINLER
ncbi:Prefoldin beta-like protein [Fimicolochytrium jonesii]|uniref:Prefoldin beta-like protein n=1 Tax=Fimicolochytrium jonesii TaxID=1396493 RepID=UPI0022FE2D1E|nr:Prefoldin beta-like protein [Fimicolochytrium jonesii]KAI8823443.1 Prefoldin beta-like protein [Fimicolochytrium jonesii]